MRHILFTAVLALASMMAIAQERIALPAPDKQVNMPLYQALQQRHSVRAYQNRTVSDATLAQVLWAACGYNRPEEKRITAASAINAQDIEVYVVRPDGAYRYDVVANALVRVTNKDLRPLVAGRQTQVATAPVMLVLVSNQTHFAQIGDSAAGQRMGMLDAGYVSQNVYLSCTALGLGTVARATMDTDALRQALGLDDHQLLLLNHPMGLEQTQHNCCKQ